MRFVLQQEEHQLVVKLKEIDRTQNVTYYEETVNMMKGVEEDMKDMGFDEEIQDIIWGIEHAG